MTPPQPARVARAVRVCCATALLLVAGPAAAAAMPAVGHVPVDFLLFALTLLGVALFHHHTLRVAWIGLRTITA